MTEWLKLMLEEIARKQAERDSALAEATRRADERASSKAEGPAAPARNSKHARSGKT
jgi:hypothetical protein